MEPEDLEKLLRQVRAGKLPVAEAARRLGEWPYAELGFAKVDHQRRLRCGMAEVVFGPGKKPEEIVAIVERTRAHAPVVLSTRLSSRQAKTLLERFPSARHNARARTVRVGRPPNPKNASRTQRKILVVSAGTSDLRVAEEAHETLLAFGANAETLYDVGIAGLHRLLDHLDHLRQAAAIIVVAGMEGALPSVVGGLVPCPVLAVPTSVGYGASFKGLAALLGMLNTCAAGVTVVNIDNGFGAASAALRILNLLPGEQAKGKGRKTKTSPANAKRSNAKRP